jgi:hypothetical protein
MDTQFGTMEVTSMTNPSASLRRYRCIFLLAALSVLAVTVLATNAAAWTSEDLNPAEKEYRSAFVYFWGSEYYRDEYVLPSYTSIPVSSSYGGYMSYPVSHIDDRTHIESASISIIARNAGSVTLNVKVMDREFHELDPEIALTSIWKATSAGTVSISTGLAYRTYTVSITGSALDDLRDVIAGDDDYLVIAFDLSSLGWVDLFARYIDISGTYYSTLTIEYDDEAPDVPPAASMDPYVIGDHVPVTWSAAADNPSGGNVGGVTYQVAIYLPGAPADNPYHTGPWVGGASWNFTGPSENIDYTFRVRARDGSGFASNWSAPVNTTIDNSPPTVPVLVPRDPFTGYLPFAVEWPDSADVGSGNVSYHLQMSLEPQFYLEASDDFYTIESNYLFSDLVSNWTYYWHARARDDLGHWSSWSRIISTTIDTEPPTVPVPFEEPEFTPGYNNTFHWHPSIDGGSGVIGYVYVIDYKPVLGMAIIIPRYTNATSASISGVTEINSMRVKARDALGHESEWSEKVFSTMDASPPSTPDIWGLPEFVPEGPLTLTWDPSVDLGVGLSHYGVWWHAVGPPGSSPMLYSIDVIGHTITIPDLGEAKWRLGVYAVDRFGNTSPVSIVNTTVDGTPPTRPILQELSEYSKGTNVTLHWTPSTDDGSGIDGYSVSYWPSSNIEHIQTGWTNETEITIEDLTDDMLYSYRVTAFDLVGNEVSSNTTHSTQDASPPLPPIIPNYRSIIDSDEVVIRWFSEPDINGMPLEFQVRYYYLWAGSDGEIPMINLPWTSGTNVTVTGLEDAHWYSFHVVARDSLGWVSAPSDLLEIEVDMTPPAVKIISPVTGERHSGTIEISGRYDDNNKNSYLVQYRANSASEWDYILYQTLISDPNSFVVHWDTEGLPDGEYTIQVGSVDDVGQWAYDEVEVTLANAHLSVSPLDIVFSDTRPEKGDTVRAMVGVRNEGDSAAMVTVDIYENGALVMSYQNLTIGAHSQPVFLYDLKVSGTHEITARVHSDLYDTGEMESGATVKVHEDEGGAISAGGAATWVGLLAIILSVIAIALNVVSRRDSEGQGTLPSSVEDKEEIKIDAGEAWEETRTEQP